MGRRPVFTVLAAVAAVPLALGTTAAHASPSGNGTCPTSVWCTAGSGWDGPTGLGTPNGISAF